MPWSFHCFISCIYNCTVCTDCFCLCFAGTNGQDHKGKGKPTEEVHPKTGYCNEGGRILKDQLENPGLHSAAERVTRP